MLSIYTINPHTPILVHDSIPTDISNYKQTPHHHKYMSQHSPTHIIFPQPTNTICTCIYKTISILYNPPIRTIHTLQTNTPHTTLPHTSTKTH